jgi:transposase
MPAERVSMRQIREVLRLRFASKLPQRAIAKSLRLSQGTVSGYLSRARAAGVSWPLPEDLDDVQLEALLFPPSPAIAADQRPVPDWAWVHRELRRPNVTLALLWEEYRAGAPDGFGYSWFCDLYRGWAGRNWRACSPTICMPAQRRLRGPPAFSGQRDCSTRPTNQ